VEVSFKDVHKGERAFLIAGGPSLSEIDLSKLEHELIYSVSLTYKVGLPHIDYHFIGDKNIVRQFAGEVSDIPARHLFVSKGIWDTGLVSHPNMHYFTGHGERKFHGDVTGRIYGGGTSTYLAMQFAYHMGISPLFVVGLDHSWNLENTKGTGKIQGGKELLETVGEDLNHFGSEYYPDGVQWFDPNTEKMAEAYGWAREAYEADGRLLLNASTRTELPESIIPRVDYKDIWNVKSP
jgi:hypothetical protein